MALGAEISEYDVPKSRGVPPVVRWFAVVGLALILYMGAITIVNAGENHWPAQDTPKIPLRGSLI